MSERKTKPADASVDPLEAAARRGDVDKIVAALAGDSLHRLDHREALRQIDAAIAVQTAEGDDALICPRTN